MPTARVLVGDTRQRLAELPDCSVQTCVTSPPYWGLRDYGHDGQIGLEQTPDEYVAELVEVFREVRRVLADDGTLWLNLGDTYGPGKQLQGIPWRVAFAMQSDGWWLRQDIIWAKPNPMPESVTDRCTKAHEYVFLLTKSARYFYDAKALAEIATLPPGATWSERKKAGAVSGNRAPSTVKLDQTHKPGNHNLTPQSGMRNKRSVWTIPTKPYAGAHFAVMPEALAEPCILAGSRPPGKRCDCDEVVATPLGSGSADDPTMLTGRKGMNRPRRPGEGTRPITRREQREYAQQLKRSPHRAAMQSEAGSAFAHYVRTDASGARPIPPSLLADWTARGWLTKPTPCDHGDMVRDVVLDPFAGSGTVGVVALRHDRDFIGTELNPEYAALAEARIYDDGPLMNAVTLSA